MIIDKYLIPKTYDRRVKLTDNQRAEIVKIRTRQGLSYNKLAAIFGVSKRLIIFVCCPDSLTNCIKCRQEKGGNYYSRLYQKERTGVAKEFRQHKKQLLRQNKLIKKEAKK